MDKLTEKQRRFVEAYMGEAAGNGTQAARIAGYNGSESVLAATSSRMLRKGKVANAVAAAQKADPLIATREERQQFWTRVMRGLEPEARMPDRLKAAELLGKSSADFIERHEVNAKVSDGYSFGVTRPKADAETHPARTH